MPEREKNRSLQVWKLIMATLLVTLGCHEQQQL